MHVSTQHTLFFFCFANELFFVALYVMNSYHTPMGLSATLDLLPADVLHLLPASLFKLLNTITWPQLIALVTFPVMFMKQVINCVQFWKASKVLVQSDQEERWAKLHAKDK